MAWIYIHSLLGAMFNGISIVTDYRTIPKRHFASLDVPLCFLTSYVLLLIRHRRHSLATYFMYLYHLISIALQSSRSCISLPLQSLQLWARPAYRTASDLYIQRLLSNQSANVFHHSLANTSYWWTPKTTKN